MIKSLVFKAAETGEEAVRRSIALIKALLAKDVLDHLQARPQPCSRTAAHVARPDAVCDI